MGSFLNILDLLSTIILYTVVSGCRRALLFELVTCVYEDLKACINFEPLFKSRSKISLIYTAYYVVYSIHAKLSFCFIQSDKVKLNLFCI